MGYSHVQRFSTDVETTFGTDQVETYRDQRLVQGSLDLAGLDEPPIPDMTVVQRLHDRNAHVDGSQFGSAFKAGFYLDGLAAALDTAAGPTHPANNIAEVVAACMGGQYVAAGSTVLGAGATTTVIPVQVGHGVRYRAGGFCIISGELRRIKSIAGDSLTLAMALNAAPANAVDVYNTQTFFLDEDGFGTDAQTLICRMLGGLAGDQFIARGVVGKFTLELGLRKLLQMNVDFQAASWAKVAGETLAGPTYTGGGPLALKNVFLWWQTVGTTTRNILSVDEFSADPGLNYIPEEAGNGINQVMRFRQLAAKPKIAIEAHGFRNFDEFWTEFDALTRKSFLLQIGNTPRVGGVGTGVVGIELPVCDYSRAPKRMARGELVRVGIELEGDEDTDTSPLTTDIQQSAVRLVVG